MPVTSYMYEIDVFSLLVELLSIPTRILTGSSKKTKQKKFVTRSNLAMDVDPVPAVSAHAHANFIC